MIIYINKGNPHGLKVQICVNAAGVDIPIKDVASEDYTQFKVAHFPLLDLENDTQLFSSDAIIRYLLPNEQPVELRDQWLEWCSTRLAPAIIQKNTVARQEQAQAETILNHLIHHLNAALSSSQFLLGSQPTSADYSVWSFLSQDKSTLKLPKVIDWFKRVGEANCVKKLGDLENLKIDAMAASKANKFGGALHVKVEIPVVENETRSLNDSPNLITETVTAAELQASKNAFVYVEQQTVPEQRTVLPKKGERNILITSALPYVNNVPHLGNIIGCVLSADIFARYCRLAGYNTLYISGTDEYGTATETKAIAENLTPQQICDKYFEIHNNIYRWFGIGFDYFGRTSTPEQKTIVQTIFKELLDAGYLDVEKMDQLLCQKCDRFLADRFVEGTCPHPECGYEDARGDQCDGCGKLVNAVELIRPRCKLCNTAPVVRESKHFFINLPKIEDNLRQWFEKISPPWTNNARVITSAWLKEGLKSRCITRDLKWGIPVPYKGFEDKVFYVWFDAVLGYISITSKYTKEWKQWWQPANKDIKIDLFQFMAKDNVPFHSVVFPATLLAINKGYTTCTHIMATEYLNYEDGKFSKSRGIGVFGNDAQDTGIHADVWRYYLASARPEGQDSSFSWNDLVARNNSELLNNLGNFVNRALVFCEKNFNSTISPINATEAEYTVLALINREIREYVQAMEKAKLRDGIRHILSISRHGNQYLQSQQPWVLLKGTDEEKQRAATIISFCCNITCLLASLLFPFMPETSRTICSQLNTQRCTVKVDKPLMQLYLKSGHKIGKPAPLFTKIEQQRLDELKKKYGGSQAGSKDSTPSSATPTVALKTAKEAEAAVAAQGDVVRKLKASGAEKTDVQAQVNILLQLKKQLASFQLGSQANGEVNHNADTGWAENAWKIKEVEAKIAEQGEKVRKVKLTSDKSVWKPEVDKLLALKKELAALGETPAAPPQSSGKNRGKK